MQKRCLNGTAITGVDTPFLTMAKKGSAAARYHEWQTDTLVAAAANAQVEGDDASADAAPATVRPGNRVQILRKVAQTSGTVEAVKKAGRKSELAYQMAKRAKEIKRDTEYALVRNQGTTTGSTTTGATLGSIESWLTSNIVYAGAQGGATTPGYSSGAVAPPVDPTATATFTEAMLKSLVKQCWDNGGEPDMLMVDSFNKQIVSGFTGIATLYRDTAPKLGPAAIIGSADIYVSDFGQLKVVPGRQQRAQTALLLDFNYLSVDYLRPWSTVDLAKTGDNTRKMMIGELTLKVDNEAAHGKVVGLAAS